MKIKHYQAGEGLQLGNGILGFEQKKFRKSDKVDKEGNSTVIVCPATKANNGIYTR
jgi:hypothetical protein